MNKLVADDREKITKSARKQKQTDDHDKRMREQKKTTNFKCLTK